MYADSEHMEKVNQRVTLVLCYFYLKYLLPRKRNLNYGLYLINLINIITMFSSSYSAIKHYVSLKRIFKYFD